MASFRVDVAIPQGCDKEGMREYIEKAVRIWVGSMDPDDDFVHGFDRKSVVVTTLKRSKNVKKVNGPQ